MSAAVIDAKSLHRLVLGAGGVLAIRLLGALAQFAFYLLLGRAFGAAGLGLFVLAFAMTSVASMVARWGVDQLALRRWSVHHARGEHAEARELLVGSSQVVVVLGLLMAAVIWLLSPLIARVLFDSSELGQMLRILSGAVPAMALLQLMGESLRARGRPALSALVQSALAPVAALLLLLLLARDGGSAVVSAWVYLAATFAALLCGAAAQYSAWPHAQPRPASCASLGRLLASATPFAWISILSVWLSYSETLLLAGFRGSVEVGQYGAALRLVLLVNFLLLAFNTLLAPRFAVLHRQGNPDAVRGLARTATLAMLALAAPFFFVLFFFPEALLGWFGGEFRAAWPAVVILAAGQLVNVGAGPVGTILLMSGQESVMKRHTLVAVAVNLTAGLALIPIFGIIGAACSAALGMVVMNVLALRSVTKLLRPDRPHGAASA